ncbi:MAG: heme ABC exporter ATP-binding protein CcmA [Alphaproteobacteria bacterium]
MKSDLTAQSLTVDRGGRRVLDGVSFSVPVGQALIVRGPNGSGKTTLLRALAGLLEIAGGDVSDLEGCVAYQAHLDAVKPQLSVADNLAFWVAFGGGNAAGALEKVGLGALADLPVQFLSAGQRRRLAVARMIALGKPVWLMDEPTAALDAQGRAMVAKVVQEHLSAGGMALIASHDDLALDAAVLELGV